MTHITRGASAEAALSFYARDPDIRILRRVSSLDDFPLAPRGTGPFRKIAIIDTETTGTAPLTDEVIDIAVVTLNTLEDGTGVMCAIITAAWEMIAMQMFSWTSRGFRQAQEPTRIFRAGLDEELGMATAYHLMPLMLRKGASEPRSYSRLPIGSQRFFGWITGAKRLCDYQKPIG